MSESDAVRAWLARRAVAPQWRGFLRALLDTFDAHLDRAARDALLRSVGARLAAATPLPPCDSLVMLEARMNEALAAMDWGYCTLAVAADGGALQVGHAAAPLAASAGDPGGEWIGAVLEGLYAGWFAAQPGGEPGVPARVTAAEPGRILLRYGRG